MRAVVILVLALLGSVPTARAGAPSGWKFHAGAKGKPAVLLVHGLAASRTHWTSPADTWSIKNGHYKHWKSPKKQSGTSKLPKIKGDVRSIVLSAVDTHADEDGSFWRFLVDQGFTVATWNQVPCMDTDKVPSNKCMNSDLFAAAYPSALEALAHLATLTTENIAIVAHSRGGLIGRKLLKEKDDAFSAIKRVKWFITLHTPHHGSSMATKGNDVQKALKNPLKGIDLGFVPNELVVLVKKLMPGVGDKLAKSIDVLVVLTGLAGARELDGQGALIRGLESNESKRAGVKYYTFGGTSPRLARVWARVYSDGGTDWKTAPRELLDFPGDLKIPFDELKSGGDLLVTNESSRLSFEDRHFKNKLNHAEVLWNKGVQRKVAALLVPEPTVTDDEVESGTDDTEDDPDDDVTADPAAPDPAPRPN
jgi:pimeloyl-ACP methyl ester carboxylesterase